MCFLVETPRFTLWGTLFKFLFQNCPNYCPQEPKVFIELIDESLQKMEQAVPQEMLTAKKLWETGDLKEGFEISENNIQFLNQDAMEKVSKIKLTLLEIEFIKK